VDKQRFIEELNFITKQCASMAQEYAALRGAMNSLEGLKEKYPRVGIPQAVNHSFSQ
jgi:prefoldin subunit 5